MTDRELLSRYARTGADAALDEIVARHAPAVYSTCLRILGDPGGAEDAAQGAFLVFLRKGRSLPDGTVLAGWFFRTAELAARDLRKARERQARREREAAMIRSKADAGGPSWEELRPELDAALAALPARQQEVLVLRYLHGRSEREICEELGAPQSTVATRLAAGIEKLRRRLAGRGLAVPAAALAGMLAANAVGAAPAGLAAAIGAACAGKAAVSAAAAGVAGGVVRALALAKLKLAAVCLAAAGVAAAAGGIAVHSLAGGEEERVWVEPDYTPNPEVTRVLGTLGAGCSAELPPVRTAGELNAVARRYGLDRTGPGGRNYSVKMPWMPERNRAIFCGANHRIPHRLNDVWEFDLPSNSWVCLYGPDDLGAESPAWNRVRVEDGVLRTPRGGPAIMGNGEWQSTYVPEMKAMAFRSIWSIYGRSLRERLISRSTHHPGLWYFSPEKRRWEPQRCRPPAPGGAHATYLEYLPAVGKIAWFGTGQQSPGMWLLDPRTLESEALWTGEEFRPGRNPELPPGDGVSAYCPDRNLVVVAGRVGEEGFTAQFDVAARTWTRTAAGSGVPAGHMSFTPFGYDSASGCCLLYDQRDGRLWAYDVAARKWERVNPAGPPPPRPGAKVFGYCDPARNAFVLCQEEKVWVYRHRLGR